MPIRTYRYRLYPTAAQHERLQAILANERRLYNGALEERVSAWRKARKSIGLNDQTKSLTEIRRFDADYGGVAYNLSKWTLKRLDDAFKGFFSRVKAGGTPGFPRYRGAGRWNTFGLHQIGGLRVRSDNLQLVGVTGKLRYRCHYPVPAGAVPKSATFTKEAGIWSVAIAFEVPLQAMAAAPAGTLVGVDVGIEALATLSNGTRIDNPQTLSKSLKELRRRQRAVARCRRGSKRRRKQVAALAATHRKVRNTRKTALHTATKLIASRFRIIAVEDLQLRNMTRSAKGTVEAPGSEIKQKAGLNRALLDASLGQFIQMLKHKAESAGGRVIEVDPRGTSQECSACGSIVVKSLRDRWHRCLCGASLHRDHNAAINIAFRAQLDTPARRRGDGKLADVKPVRPRKTAVLAA